MTFPFHSVMIRNLDSPQYSDVYTQHSCQVNVAKYSPSRFESRSFVQLLSSSRISSPLPSHLSILMSALDSTSPPPTSRAKSASGTR